MRYSRQGGATGNGDWCTVSIRYKEPQGSTGKTLSVPVTDRQYVPKGSPDTRMAAAVAAFGMLLDNSEHKGNLTYDDVSRIASDPAVSNDDYRREFLGLVSKAKRLAPAR